jgi:hypothetical protein
MSTFQLDVTAFVYLHGVVKDAAKIIISSDIIYTRSDLNYTIIASSTPLSING